MCQGLSLPVCGMVWRLILRIHFKFLMGNLSIFEWCVAGSHDQKTLNSQNCLPQAGEWLKGITLAMLHNDIRVLRMSGWRADVYMGCHLASISILDWYSKPANFKLYPYLYTWPITWQIFKCPHFPLIYFAMSHTKYDMRLDGTPSDSLALHQTTLNDNRLHYIASVCSVAGMAMHSSETTAEILGGEEIWWAQKRECTTDDSNLGCRGYMETIGAQMCVKLVISKGI